MYAQCYHLTSIKLTLSSSDSGNIIKCGATFYPIKHQNQKFLIPSALDCDPNSGKWQFSENSSVSKFRANANQIILISRGLVDAATGLNAFELVVGENSFEKLFT